MAMRLSGLMSGMDTESVIEQLVMARRTKVDDTKKAQTKLQWKTDAWKTLNSKILKLYNGILGSTMRFEGSYMKKVTKVSNSSVVSVLTGDNAMNTVQTLKVKQMAKPSYLTGGQVGHKATAQEKEENPWIEESTKGKLNLDSDSRMQKLGYAFNEWGRINVTVGDQRTMIYINGATTMGELVQSFRDAGLNASFDEKNQRFYISAKDTGEASDFTITAADFNGLSMLEDLGLSYTDKNVTGYYDNIVKMGEDVDQEVENRLQGRLDSTLKGLIDRRIVLEEQKENLIAQLEDLKNKYSDEFKDVDISDPEQVKAAIDRVIQNAEAGDNTLSDADKKWMTDLGVALANTEEELSNINSRLTEPDEDGNVGFADEEGEKNAIKATLKTEIESEIADAKEMLKILNEAAEISGAIKDDGKDAVIELNGVEYKSSKNTFEINGLTLTVNATTSGDDVVTLTTQDDTDGIYDMIKSFIKEYSELINEMDKLYNAESSKGYEPLTNEEKEAMTDADIEEWEKKIKDSVLRKDDTLGTLSNALKQLMLSGINVHGKTMYLSNFGIETLSYFTAPENEKNAYHIDGDPDDSATASNEDKLRTMIATDPQTVIDFFVGLSRNMYAEMTTRMARTEYSSAYTAYEDVRMKKEYDEYTSKIKELEKKLSDYEDKWYQKFAKMETALAKLQNSASAVTSLLGG